MLGLLGSLIVIALMAGGTALALRLQKRAERRRRDGLCTRCAAVLHADERFWVEGRLVCGSCAARSRRRIIAALWGLGAVALLGLVSGITGNVQDWLRGYGVSLIGLAAGVGAPLSIAVMAVVAVRSMRSSNHLARELEAIEYRIELLSGTSDEARSGPPAT